MTWMWLAVALGGYLFGSLPIGLIVGRVAHRVDIRDYGSGKTGMTNALRTLGLKAALLVLVGDLLKGALPVLVVRFLGGDARLEVVAALTAIAGHDWPLYAGFRGGRGVATSLGALSAMAPLVGLAALPVAALVLYPTRYVSLMSIVSALFCGAALIALALTGRIDAAYAVFGAVAAPLIVVLHHDNIARLLAGTERRLGQRADGRVAGAAETARGGR